ncbi:MAG: 3-oxoacyl-ACP synthase III family protein, partial [Candidatus Hodarchaeota archaeon]
EEVAKKALTSAKLKPFDIDYIIAANIGGKRLYPLVGSYIHKKLKFNRETPVLNVQNWCAGFIDQINVAWSLILSGRYKRILIVDVTTWALEGWGIDQTGPLAKLFGDGAGAAIVSAENLLCEFLSYYNHTVGELYDHMVVELMPHMTPELKEKAGVKGTMGNYLIADNWFFEWQQAEGKEFAVEIIKGALQEAKMTVSDLDMVIIHHAQDVIHNRWIEGGVDAGISKEKWKDENWNKYGNIGNVDIPANLVGFIENGQIQKGSVIALFAPGLGGHTPCMILKWLV